MALEVHSCQNYKTGTIIHSKRGPSVRLYGPEQEKGLAKAREFSSNCWLFFGYASVFRALPKPLVEAFRAHGTGLSYLEGVRLTREEGCEPTLLVDLSLLIGGAAADAYFSRYTETVEKLAEDGKCGVQTLELLAFCEDCCMRDKEEWCSCGRED